jgi:hypothetical protein
VVAGVAMLAGLAAVPGARAVGRPAGAPDLAAMALGVRDLPAGASVKSQGYATTEDFVAEYDRDFAPGTVRLGGKRLLELQSVIDLARSAGEASIFVSALRQVLRTKAGRAALVKQVKSGFSSSDLKPDHVRVGKAVSLGVGEDSLAFAIDLGTPLGDVQLIFSVIRVDRIVSGVIYAGNFGAKLAPRSSTPLQRSIAAHIRAGLTPVDVTPPAIAGTPQVGQTLTATAGTWTNAPAGYAYQWQRCDASGAACAPIAGATATTYAPSAPDAGATIRVSVIASNAAGKSAAATSSQTAVVAATAAPPASTNPPAISGQALQGQTLTATTGDLTNAPTAFAYQWQDCDATGTTCTDIAGATASTYVVGPGDVGKTIRVGVTATNVSGAATAFSAVTAVVS